MHPGLACILHVPLKHYAAWNGAGWVQPAEHQILRRLPPEPLLEHVIFALKIGPDKNSSNPHICLTIAS